MLPWSASRPEVREHEHPRFYDMSLLLQARSDALRLVEEEFSVAERRLGVLIDRDLDGLDMRPAQVIDLRLHPGKKRFGQSLPIPKLKDFLALGLFARACVRSQSGGIRVWAWSKPGIEPNRTKRELRVKPDRSRELSSGRFTQGLKHNHGQRSAIADCLFAPAIFASSANLRDIGRRARFLCHSTSCR